MRHFIHTLISTSCNDVCTSCVDDSVIYFERDRRLQRKGMNSSLEQISVQNNHFTGKHTQTSRDAERKQTEPWLAVQSPYQTSSLPPPHRVSLPPAASYNLPPSSLLTRSPRISRSTVRTIRQTSLFTFGTPPDTSGNAFASRFSLIFPSPRIVLSLFPSLDVHSPDASPLMS